MNHNFLIPFQFEHNFPKLIREAMTINSELTGAVFYNLSKQQLHRIKVKHFMLQKRYLLKFNKILNRK